MSEPTPEPPPPPPPGGEAAPAPAPAAKPGRRWKRILLFSLLGLLALLGALVAMLPAILSSDLVRKEAESRASESSGRRVALGGLDVGWSAAEVRDIEVRWGPGEDSPVLARVGAVRIPAGISAAWADRYAVDAIEILRPEIRVDLRELTKPAPASPAAPAAPAAPAGKPSGGGSGEGGGRPLPPWSVKVKVRDGTLVIVGLDGKESRFGSFDADLSASGDGVADVTLALDAGPGGKARLHTTTSPFKDGRPPAREALEATVDLVLESFDLAPLREPACALGNAGLDELKGSVSATLSARATGAGDVENGVVALEITGLAVAGPALGPGVRIEEPSIVVKGGFRRGRDGALDLQDGLLRLKGLEARASLALAAAGALNGTMTATAALDENVARAKRAGAPFTGYAVGDATLEARVVTDGSGQRFSGSAGFRDVQFAFGPGKRTVDEPSMRMEFDLSRAGKAWTVSSAGLRSADAELSASGTVREDLETADLRAHGKVNLGPALKVAKAFGVPLPGEVAGLAELDVHLLRTGKGKDGDTASGSLVVTDLAVKPPGEGSEVIREPRFEAKFEAVPGKDSLEVKSLTVAGAGADLRAAGTAAMDGSSGSLTTCEADLDLGKAAALAGSLGAALPVRIAGTATWKGPLSWKGGGAEADAAGSLVVRGLSATLPASGTSPERTLREEEVRADLDAVARTAKGGAGRDLVLRRAVLAAKGLDVSVAGTASPDGTLDLQAKGTLSIPEALRRAAELKVLDRDPGTKGTLDFDLAVKGKPGDLQGTVRALEAKGAEFDLHGSGAFSEKGAGDLALDAGGDVATLVDLAVRAGLLQPVKDAAGKATLKGTAKSTGPDDPLRLTLEAAVEGLRWPDPQGGAPWTQKSVRATVDVSLDRKAPSVTGTAALRADDGTATVQGSALLAEGRRAVDASADLDIDLGGLCRSRPDLLPMEDVTVGRAKGRMTLKGPLETPFDLAKFQGTAKLSLDSVKTKPLELKDAAMDLLLQGGTATLQALTATVNGGKVSGKAAFGFAGADPKHFLEARAEGVQVDGAMEVLLEDVVPLFSAGDRGGVSGRLRCDVRLDAQGADWKTAKGSLHGKGSLAVTDGSISGNGILVEVLDFLGGGKGITFSSISTDFQVHDRRVWNERILVDGKEHLLIFHGSTTFRGDLDYTAGVKVRSLGKKLEAELRPLLDKEGNLVFEIKGTVSKPKVKPPGLKKILGR